MAPSSSPKDAVFIAMPPSPAKPRSPRVVTNAPEDGNRYWQAYVDTDELAQKTAESGIAVGDIEKSHGLPSASIDSLRATYGFNRLSPPPPERVQDYVLFLRQFLDMFMILLSTAGVLSLVAYLIDTSVSINLYLGLVLFAIVLGTCTMTFLQQRWTSKVMDSFFNMLPQKCTVVRDAKSQFIPADELVAENFVWVRNGDKVPADIRILLCSNLKVENSSLTGESELVSLTSKPMDASVAALECKNVAFNGSLCFDGSALGLVLSIGDSTVIGRIAKLASSTEQRETTMQREVKSFVRFISILAISMAGVLFAIGVIRKNVSDVLNTVIGGFLVIIVANVPQGLPATVTSLLTITATRMATHNIFVKRLDCVETLGSITLVATDKTGRVTKNVMTGNWLRFTRAPPKTMTLLWLLSRCCKRCGSRLCSKPWYTSSHGDPCEHQTTAHGHDNRRSSYTTLTATGSLTQWPLAWLPTRRPQLAPRSTFERSGTSSRARSISRPQLRKTSNPRVTSSSLTVARGETQAQEGLALLSCKLYQRMVLR